jgi:hypothetical protein
MTNYLTFFSLQLLSNGLEWLSTNEPNFLKRINGRDRRWVVVVAAAAVAGLSRCQSASSLR